MNQYQDPRHAAFDAMTDEERRAHIRQHTFIAEAEVATFEITTRNRIHLIADKYWGDVIFYTSRHVWMTTSFAVDRRLPFEEQSALFQRGLEQTMAAYHGELLDRELKKILQPEQQRQKGLTK